MQRSSRLQRAASPKQRIDTVLHLIRSHAPAEHFAARGGCTYKCLRCAGRKLLRSSCRSQSRLTHGEVAIARNTTKELAPRCDVENVDVGCVDPVEARIESEVCARTRSVAEASHFGKNLHVPRIWLRIQRAVFEPNAYSPVPISIIRVCTEPLQGG